MHELLAIVIYAFHQDHQIIARHNAELAASLMTPRSSIVGSPFAAVAAAARAIDVKTTVAVFDTTTNASTPRAPLVQPSSLSPSTSPPHLAPSEAAHTRAASSLLSSTPVVVDDPSLIPVMTPSEPLVISSSVLVDGHCSFLEADAFWAFSRLMSFVHPLYR
jgi:hypothetical protein